MKVCGWNYATAAKEVDKLIGNFRLSTIATIHSRYQTETRFALCGRKVALWSRVMRLQSIWLGAASWIIGLPFSAISTARITLVCWRLFTDLNGKPSTLHRTFLLGEGKASGKFMPGKIAKGGAVRLAPFTDKLGIAEGIETAMSAASIFIFLCGRR